MTQNRAKDNEISFLPFGNESQVITVGSLQVENRLDRVSLTGNLDITKDKLGLEKALELKGLLDGVVQSLQREDLSETIRYEPTSPIKNPFN
jgi:hypothetical protein